MDERVNYLEFVVYLRRLVNERETAAMRIVTDDRHYISIGLHEGRIVSLHAGPRKGARALERIKQMTGGGITLTAEDSFDTQSDLPTTNEILGILEQKELEGLQSTRSPRPPSIDLDPGTTPAPFRPEVGPNSVDTSEFIADLYRIEEKFLHYVGPIAKMLFQDVLAETGKMKSHDDLIRLTEILSREIDDPEKAARFRREALAS